VWLTERCHHQVMQFPEKEFEGASRVFLDATQKASGALLALPDDAVFRSAKARPPQLPSCAVKCIVGVNDGFLYLVKAR
jgi:hypothetical protein